MLDAKGAFRARFCPGAVACKDVCFAAYLGRMLLVCSKRFDSISMPTDLTVPLSPKVYQSYRTLKKELGRLDAAVELSELGLRCLTESASNTTTFTDLVGAASSRHGLHVKVSDAGEAHRVLALSGIANAHSAYELFLGDIANEAVLMIGVDIDMGKRPQDISKHDYFMGRIRQLGYKHVSEEYTLLEKVLTYFRFVRVNHIHKGFDGLRQIEVCRKRIASSDGWENVFPNRRKPPAFEKLGFEDFLVFTQAVRLTAKHIAQLLVPGDDGILKHQDFIAFRKDNESNPTRLRLFLRDRFALDDATSVRISGRS